MFTIVFACKWVRNPAAASATVARSPRRESKRTSASSAAGRDVIIYACSAFFLRNVSVTFRAEHALRSIERAPFWVTHDEGVVPLKVGK